MPSIVDVAVPVGVRKTFSYSVPSGMRDSIAVGMRVLVPFGRKVVTGYVVGYRDQSQISGLKLRPIQRLLDPEPAVSATLVETALWVAHSYFAPPGEVFRALFPAGMQLSGNRRVSLTSKAKALISGGLRPEGLRPQELAILDILAHEESIRVKELVRQSAIRNAEPWIESLNSAGLIELEILIDRPRVRSKEQLGIRRLDADPKAAKELRSAQSRLYTALESTVSAVPLREVLRSSDCTYGVARSLERKGLVEIVSQKIQRTPFELAEVRPADAPVLTLFQQQLVERLLEISSRGAASRCLVHGVTGSGKTEIYLRLIAEVLKRGGEALFLVPEIGLTPLLSRLVVSRFPNQVSLLHSGMSAGERFDQWSRICEGNSRVVVGTRSAVFAPLKEPRLIIIDEEQDPSYKQDESPCYHAREVAWHRIQQTRGMLVLGSATPSLETFHWATQQEDVSYFYLPERVEARPMPEVKIVDMSLEFQRHGKNVVISETLEKELNSCMQRGEQAIVLLNRRGYSRTLLCRSCGHVFACPDCSVSMTYHQQEDCLVCHYCGRERDVPSLCVQCGGPYIYYTGVGTEQLENILRTLLPKARIARLDRDTARRRSSLRTTLFDFAEHRLDLLVGTQMLAKGHDFPKVTTVGVVAADAGLSFPDFRSAERTFQLLIQVAGRAGRGTAPGRVVIQSFYPNNYVLQCAQRQDYKAFYGQEINFRRLMGYPPYRNLIQILTVNPNADKAARMAEKIAHMLKLYVDQRGAGSKLRILGPAAAPLEKLRGNYRMQLLIKYHPGADAISILQDCFADLSRQRFQSSKVHVDVDPLSLL